MSADTRSDRLRPTHDSVPGRIRLEVAGLYRTPAVASVLERQLTDLPGVKGAKASALTGCLLIRFSPERIPLDSLIDEVLSLIEPYVEGRRLRAAGSSRQRAQAIDAIGPGASGFVDLLKSLISTAHAAPAFAAISAPNAKRVDSERAQENRPWHAMEAKRVIAHFKTSQRLGLSCEDARKRLLSFGPNTLEGSARRSDLSIFLSQFNSLPVGLLGASAVVSVITGGAADAVVILGVVLINSAIGFVTERQAERTIASLANTTIKTSQVLRDGKTQEIDTAEIVPGDVMVLAPGSYIAADLRLVSGHRLSVDESALTGESLPVNKDPSHVAADDTTLGDRVNMSYMGTYVTGGSGSGVVIATAKASELGQIQTMVGEAQAPETPMQRQLGRMGTQLAVLSGAVCAGVFGVGILRGIGWLQMLKSSVSLAVAAVPEGLPAVATTTLAMGIRDMGRRNAAVRHLDAVESLGSVQVFCLDKTGTLTLNRMAVVAIHAGDREIAITEGVFTASGTALNPQECSELLQLMHAASLCSDVVLSQGSEQPQLEGSATERALVELALNAGVDVDALRETYPTLKTRYRAEGRPYMSTLHADSDGKALLAVKGSPETLLSHCSHWIRNGKRLRLDDQTRNRILEQNQRMAGQALRVLGIACRDLKSPRMPAKTTGLTWLGLAGMADPMRPEMDRLMAVYHRAGIRTVMITGDQSGTAEAIGRQLGLNPGGPLKVLEAGALETMDPELLAGLAKDVHVFARVTPAHKLKIVQSLQRAGYVVAMTGDGINDGPALKAANVGVAMGQGGTDLARSVSDVVLEDDNLQTMEEAIRRGRTIYNNIRKTIHFMVSTNFTEIEIMLACLALGRGEALNPMQLLWVNLVTDIFPGLALSLEAPEPDIMQRPPRDPHEPIIRRRDLKRMIFESGAIGAGTMAAFLYGQRRYGMGAPQARTLAFTSLTLNELVHALSSRSRYRTVLSRRKLPPNPHLKKAIAGMLAAQALATWVPGLRRLLGTTPLGIVDLLVVAASTLGPLVVNELTKPPLPERDPAALSSDGLDDAGSRSGREVLERVEEALEA